MRPIAPWRRRGSPESGKHEANSGQERRWAQAPLFDYRGRGGQLTVWPDGTLEARHGRQTERVSLVGAEEISVDYTGDDLPVLSFRGRVFAQRTTVVVRDRLGKTSQVSVRWAIPLKAKQQLEQVVAGFAGKVALSLASAGARLLVTITPTAELGRPSNPAAELRKHASVVHARLAADPDDGAALDAARRHPNDQAALRALTTAIHHRAELEPDFHHQLVALVDEAEESLPTRWLDVAAGAGLGLAAAAAGALGWYLTVLITDAPDGIIAMAVGTLVGWAVVVGSGVARSRRLQLVSVAVTLVGLLAAEYLIDRHFFAGLVAEEGGGQVPMLLAPGDAISLVGDGLRGNPWTFLFWALALWPAWWIPARRTGSGQGPRLPAATSRPWQLAGLAAGAVVLGGLGVIMAMMATQEQLAAASDHFTDDLQVGQCYQDPEQDQLRVVACSQRHDGEVFAIVPLPGQDLSSEAELDRLADQVCAAQFRAYVGVASHVPQLYYFGWANGNQTMVCTLETLDGTGLVGSMHNAGARRLQSVKVAQTGHAGAFRLWVTRMTCGYLQVADRPPAKRGQYCAVEFTATNTELSPAWLHAADQRLLTATGKSFNGIGVGKPLWDHDVQPGQRVTTRLVFDLPRGVRPIQLQLQGYTGHDLTGHDLGPMVTGTINLPRR